MFQFSWCPSFCLYIQQKMLLVRSSGFPHSDIPGSKPVHGSPRLIAVTHVLLRHLAPRHSPLALSSFNVMRRNRHSFIVFHHQVTYNVFYFFEIASKIWPTYYSLFKVQSALLPAQFACADCFEIAFGALSAFKHLIC